MTNDEVHSALVRWIKKVTGKTVIKAHQSVEAPDQDYVMVNFLGLAEVREHAQETIYSEAEEPESGELYPAVTATPVIEAEWRFSAHAYGDSPTDILRPVVSSHKVSQAMEPMFPALLIHELSQIRNVPDFINERWEHRAQIDITIRGLIKDGHAVEVIEEYSFDHERRA